MREKSASSKDAIVMFHDVNSPSVAIALNVFANDGWEVGIYNTMQIMGVAWRGYVKPVNHIADPGMPSVSGEHLAHLRLLSIPNNL